MEQLENPANSCALFAMSAMDAKRKKNPYPRDLQGPRRAASPEQPSGSRPCGKPSSGKTRCRHRFSGQTQIISIRGRPRTRHSGGDFGAQQSGARAFQCPITIDSGANLSPMSFPSSRCPSRPPVFIPSAEDRARISFQIRPRLPKTGAFCAAAIFSPPPDGSPRRNASTASSTPSPRSPATTRKAPHHPRRRRGTASPGAPERRARTSFPHPDRVSPAPLFADRGDGRQSLFRIQGVGPGFRCRMASVDSHPFEATPRSNPARKASRHAATANRKYRPRLIADAWEYVFEQAMAWTMSIRAG